jgi:hypothetical protein
LYLCSYNLVGSVTLTRSAASKEPPYPVRKNKAGRSGAPTRSPDRTKPHSPGLPPAPEVATTKWKKARSTLLHSDDAASTKRTPPGHLNLTNLRRQAKKHRSPHTSERPQGHRRQRGAALSPVEAHKRGVASFLPLSTVALGEVSRENAFISVQQLA